MINRKKIFYGWWLLAALFIVGALGPMSRYSITAFFPALADEFQWSRVEIGTAQSISLWAYSVLSILTGWMIDRVGSRWTIFIGGIFCLGGWLLLSSVNSLWQLYLYYGIVMAVATSNTHLVPLQSTLRKWFEKRAGLASGIIGSAFSVGSAVFIPLLTLGISAYGWREVSIFSAFAFSLPILALAFFVIRNTPESMGLRPDGTSVAPVLTPGQEAADQGTVKEGLKAPRFWLLLTAYGLIGIVVNGLSAHLVMWGVDLGQSVAASGLFISLYSGSSVVARILGGYMGDRYPKVKVMIAGNVLSAIVMISGFYLIHSPAQLIIFTPLMGMSSGFSSSLYAPYLGDMFGRKNVGSLFGILTVGWGLIGGLGPLIWGSVSDASGSYSPTLLISTACFAVVITALFIIYRTAPETR